MSKVLTVLVGATGMVTIGAEHPAWADPLKMGEVEGLFVRLVPPLNCPDVDVVRMRVQAEELGAVAVKVERVRRDETISGRPEIAPEPPRRARDIVMELVAEARTADRERLHARVERALDEAGL